MLLGHLVDVLIGGDDCFVGRLEVNDGFGLSCADVAGDVEIVVVLDDLSHAYAAGVAFDLLGALFIGIDQYCSAWKQLLHVFYYM